MLMAMEIDTNHDHFRTDYSEKVKEKQAAERAEEAKGTEAQRAGKTSQPQDEYISSENRGKSPPGCTGQARTPRAIGKSFLRIRKRAGRARDSRQNASVSV